ncbi:MAG: tRNA methyl transferase PRC-barrel domain-containing protein [Pseudomonadales bacterium]
MNWKSQKVQLAEQHGLITHDKKEPSEFASSGSAASKIFTTIIASFFFGDIINLEGNVIGRHHVMYHTIGQRQGLGIGRLKDYDEAPGMWPAKIWRQTNWLLPGFGAPFAIFRLSQRSHN